jgi:hypothetical protein
MVLGAFNRAGKSVSKIGIYALPPPKSDIYGDFYKLGRELLKIGSKNVSVLVLSSRHRCKRKKTIISFSDYFLVFFFVLFFVLCFLNQNQTQKAKTTPPSGPLGGAKCKDIS